MGSRTQEARRDALTAFIDARLGEGYVVETRTDTHAIIVEARQRPSLLRRFRPQTPPDRQVIAVADDGTVTASPAEPLRS